MGLVAESQTASIPRHRISSMAFMGQQRVPTTDPQGGGSSGLSPGAALRHFISDR